MTGFVRMLSHEKRFGFIKAEDNKDYFFHASDLNGFWDDLDADYKSNRKITVEFDPNTGPKGPRATNVSRTDWPNAAAREYNG